MENLCSGRKDLHGFPWMSVTHTERLIDSCLEKLMSHHGADVINLDQKQYQVINMPITTSNSSPENSLDIPARVLQSLDICINHSTTKTAPHDRMRRHFLYWLPVCTDRYEGRRGISQKGANWTSCSVARSPNNLAVEQPDETHHHHRHQKKIHRRNVDRINWEGRRCRNLWVVLDFWSDGTLHFFREGIICCEFLVVLKSGTGRSDKWLQRSLKINPVRFYVIVIKLHVRLYLSVK